MRDDLEQMPGLQRMSASGPVTYVYDSPRRSPAGPGMQVDAEWSAARRGGAASTVSVMPAAPGDEGTEGEAEPAEALHAPATVWTGEEEAGEGVPDRQRGSEPAQSAAPVPEPAAPTWPATRPAPAGYLYEFGTGRLLPIAFTAHSPTPGRRKAYMWRR